MYWLYKRHWVLLSLYLAVSPHIQILGKDSRRFFNYNVTVEPGLFLLNILNEDLLMPNMWTKLLFKLLLLARRCILFQWIKPRPPTVNQWHDEIFKVMPMERLSTILKDNEYYFDRLWQPFLDPWCEMLIWCCLFLSYVVSYFCSAICDSLYLCNTSLKRKTHLKKNCCSDMTTVSCEHMLLY